MGAISASINHHQMLIELTQDSKVNPNNLMQEVKNKTIEFNGPLGIKVPFNQQDSPSIFNYVKILSKKTNNQKVSYNSDENRWV